MSTNPRLVDSLLPGQSATIAALPIDAERQHRFGALGLRCGQEISVLRRGVMNGPLHGRMVARVAWLASFVFCQGARLLGF